MKGAGGRAIPAPWYTMENKKHRPLVRDPHTFDPQSRLSGKQMDTTPAVVIERHEGETLASAVRRALDILEAQGD